jgi:hypothetical protein
MWSVLEGTQRVPPTCIIKTDVTYVKPESAGVVVVVVVLLAGVEGAVLQFSPNWHGMFAVVTLTSGTVVALLYTEEADLAKKAFISLAPYGGLLKNIFLKNKKSKYRKSFKSFNSQFCL